MSVVSEAKERMKGRYAGAHGGGLPKFKHFAWRDARPRVSATGAGCVL
jgi:hypothetical protein